MANTKAEGHTWIDTVECLFCSIKRTVKTFNSVVEQIAGLEIDRSVFVLSEFFNDTQI